MRNCSINMCCARRVAGEFIQPYRRQIREVLTQIAPDMTDAEKTASVINWAKENLEIADSLNSKRLQATPSGVLSLRKSDRRSVISSRWRL